MVSRSQRSGCRFNCRRLQFGAEPELRLPRGYIVERAADLVTELQLPVA